MKDNISENLENFILAFNAFEKKNKGPAGKAEQ